MKKLTLLALVAVGLAVSGCSTSGSAEGSIGGKTSGSAGYVYPLAPSPAK